MAAFGAADSPRTAHVSRSGLNRVVLAFAETRTDGRDRREVEYVEAHLRHILQARCYVAQCSMGSWCRRPGTGKKFVPGRKTGSLAIDHYLEFVVIPGFESRIGVAMNGSPELFLKSKGDGVGIILC